MKVSTNIVALPGQRVVAISRRGVWEPGELGDVETSWWPGGSGITEYHVRLDKYSRMTGCRMWVTVSRGQIRKEL